MTPLERRAEELRARFPNALPSSATAREALVWVLAFVAGAGAHLAAVTSDPFRWQDIAGALAAGSTAALLRMFPTTRKDEHGRG